MIDNAIIENLQRNMDFFACDWEVKKEAGNYEDEYGFYSACRGELPDVVMNKKGSIYVLNSSDDFVIDMRTLRGLTECSMLLNRNYYLNSKEM
ncbi:hypothetical protein [Apilactobacillus xinyiensis]|uniref:hypothetical protein n=1 Tax=Apilactobacillus xinyiensis TaxID=2841032 RepID=UPI0020109024|nr:hypothetical protein [Apilactobacillus xinyiensis]MCL0330578.1 hypothetical protein [Apilactobacillus xinyiensis]